MYVRDDAPDDLVTRICAALEARKGTLAWDGAGPLPLERMCTNAPDAPFDVPLHRAAERFWRSTRVSYVGRRMTRHRTRPASCDN